MSKATKIIATIGPASESEEILEKMIHAGMDVARFNTKHGEPEWHHERIRRVRSIADRLQKPIAILIDLQGPEIRSELSQGKDSFEVSEGEQVIFTSNPHVDIEKAIIVPHEVVEALATDNIILIEDGLGSFRVTGIEGDQITTQAVEAITVKKRKTLNTPGVNINLPSLVQQDYTHLDAADNELVDFVALSFVRTAQDVQILRDELKQRNLNAQIIAKIENQAALDNLDEIIATADAVMVARGDLAVEVPFEELGHWQKVIIHKSRSMAKPVITATQMLMSMVDSPQPSRAEVSDVANAVYDGTDAVMLSDETTIGKHPVRAVKTQAKIVSYTEKYAQPYGIDRPGLDATTAITHAANCLLEGSEDPNNPFHISAIVCLTHSGKTARFLSRFRHMPMIHTFTDSKTTYNRLSLVYGLIPYVINMSDNELIQSEDILHFVKEYAIAKEGEVILVVHGTFWKEPGMTNTLKVLTVT
ncbi:MAG: pyruvate kinase [Patescibacteria group bacterium]